MIVLIFSFHDPDAQLKALNCTCRAHWMLPTRFYTTSLAHSVLFSILALIIVFTYNAFTSVSTFAMAYRAVCSTITAFRSGWWEIKSKDWEVWALRLNRSVLIASNYWDIMSKSFPTGWLSINPIPRNITVESAVLNREGIYILRCFWLNYQNLTWLPIHINILPFRLSILMFTIKKKDVENLESRIDEKGKELIWADRKVYNWCRGV